MCDAKKKNWQEFIANLKPNTKSGTAWKKVKCLSNMNAIKTPVLKHKNETITEAEQVADTFGKYFSTISDGNSEDDSFATRKLQLQVQPLDFASGNTEEYNAPITYNELIQAIKTSNSKSPGPDKIPFAFFKNFKKTHLNSMLKLYNFIFQTEFPMQWKQAITIPILKPNKCTTDVKSYRPIALTSCCGKIFEKILNWRLQGYLEKKRLLDTCQSGFRAAHSTLDALTRLETDIREALMLDKYVLAVFLDISQAFDTVWHWGLLKRLENCGIKGRLAQIIQSFLKNRSMKVRIGGRESDSYQMKAGVPQGSVLSPTLFLLYINDLFKQLPAHFSYSLYADDGAVWVTGTSLPELLGGMQQALHRIEQWSHTWGLEFSITKTKAIIFTHKRMKGRPILTLNQSKIEFVQQIKFLGVIFDRQLTWRQHIQHIRDKCQSDLRLMRVVAGKRWGCDFTDLRQLYLGLTRSKLDYASFLYGTAAKSNLLQLDRVQYSAVRIMLGALRCTNVGKLEEEASIMPLKIQRNLLLAQYICRVLAVPDHPVREMFSQYYPFDFYVNNKRPLSSIGRAYSELQNIGIDIKDIAVVNTHLRYHIPSNIVQGTLATELKASRTSTQWKQMFVDLKENCYPNRTPVFCDGSVAEGAVACAVWSENFNILCRLTPDKCIYTAELYAIFLAVKFLSAIPGNYVLFTDSLSCVHSLQSTERTKNSLLLKTWEALRNTPREKIAIDWVPSHMGIPGNEKADQLAKKSLTLGKITSIPLTYMEANRKIRQHYSKRRLQTTVQQQQPASCITHNSNSKAYITKISNRRHQIAITRLRLGTCLLTHKHHIQKVAREHCKSCKCPFTINHLLVECPLLSEQRQLLQSACQKLKLNMTVESILHEDFPPEYTIRFLMETGFLDKI